MSILWIYDKRIDSKAGGTERATYLVMCALLERGYSIAGFLSIDQFNAKTIRDQNGEIVEDLYRFLKSNRVSVVINQIGYSTWLLDEFFSRGGFAWRKEGGRVITKLHFDPRMFVPGFSDLLRHWSRKNLKKKFLRLGRIAMLPIEREIASRTLRSAYVHLIAQSDAFVVLSESHRKALLTMVRTPFADRIKVIQNLNTYKMPLGIERVPLKSKIALVVSRLDEPQKRISLALLAWRRVMQTGLFSDWSLRVIGDGEYRQDYLDLVATKQISNVSFLGHVDPELHYEDAALYLHTSKREGWGLTITEAMQKGVVPVVMNSSPVFAELITNEQCGVLTADGDIESFAKNLCRLMGDELLRMRMAFAAIAASSQREIEPIIDKWVSTLDVPPAIASIPKPKAQSE